jgi:hypothetical protein
MIRDAGCCVAGARRLEAAHVAEGCPEELREGQLIDPDQRDEELGEHDLEG